MIENQEKPMVFTTSTFATLPSPPAMDLLDMAEGASDGRGFFPGTS